jgi:hypothetical protein
MELFNNMIPGFQPAASSSALRSRQKLLVSSDDLTLESEPSISHGTLSCSKMVLMHTCFDY